MPDFNAVSRPMLSGAVGRLYGVEQPRTSVVSGEVQVVTSPWERPEFWALAGGSLTMATVTITGGANRNMAELRNPTSSGILVVVDWIQFTNLDPAALGFQWGIVTPTVAQLATGTANLIHRDQRKATLIGGTGGIGANIRTENAAVAVSSMLGYVLLTTGTSTPVIPMDLVLPPGTALRFFPDGNGKPLVVNLAARERPAPDPELFNL